MREAGAGRGDGGGRKEKKKKKKKKKKKNEHVVSQEISLICFRATITHGLCKMLWCWNRNAIGAVDEIDRGG